MSVESAAPLRSLCGLRVHHRASSFVDGVPYDMTPFANLLHHEPNRYELLTECRHGAKPRGMPE